MYDSSDSLARHNAIHETSASPQKVTPSPRVAKACSFCAKQRLRCDGKDSCGRCTARGLECVYLPRAKRRSSSAKWPTAGEPLSTASDHSPGYRPVRSTTSGSNDGLHTGSGVAAWGAAATGKPMYDYRAQIRPHLGDGCEHGGDHDQLSAEPQRVRYSLLQMPPALTTTPFSAQPGQGNGPTGDAPCPPDSQTFVSREGGPIHGLQRYGVISDPPPGLPSAPAHGHAPRTAVPIDDTNPFMMDLESQFSIWDWMASDIWAIDPTMMPVAIDPVANTASDPTVPSSNMAEGVGQNHQVLPSFNEGEMNGQGLPAHSIHQWPTEWNPTKQDNLIRFPNMSNAPAEILDAEDFAHVEPMAPACYEKISAAMKLHANGHGPFRPFSNANMASIEVFSVFVQLFWEYFAPSFPLLHHGTFDTGKAAWQLVLTTATIGCRFSKLPGAAQYVVGLHELLRRVIACSVSLTQLIPCHLVIAVTHSSRRWKKITARRESCGFLSASSCPAWA